MKTLLALTGLVLPLLIAGCASAPAQTVSATPSPLPHSIKGYELYSWQSGPDWHFTLITGTNRNKTTEEIMSATDNLSDDWVKIHVVGVPAIINVLSRVPPQDWVLWNIRPFYDGSGMDYPPQSIIEKIVESARQFNLQFYAPQVSK